MELGEKAAADIEILLCIAQLAKISSLRAQEGKVMLQPMLEAFPLSHAKRRLVERKFGKGRFAKVEYEPHGPLGNCYWNVSKLVQAHGGSSIYGWQILQWRGLYVQGLHHALWERPDGKLLDVTQKHDADKRSFTTFVNDDSIEIDLGQPIYVPNLFYVLKKHRVIDQLIGTSQAQLDHNRAMVEAMIEAGAEWDMGLKGTPEIKEQFADELRVERKFREEIGALFDKCAELSRRP